MSIDDIAEFSGCVSDIYDCAFDESRWPATLDRICRNLNGVYMSITMATTDRPAWEARHASPWKPEALLELGRKFSGNIPGIDALFSGPLDAPISTLDNLPEEVALQTPFYAEWATPHGLRDGGVVKFVHTAGIMGVISYVTGVDRAPITAQERLVLGRLAPHFRRAITIADTIRQQHVPNDTYRQSLEALALPILITDGSGKLSYVNASADHLLNEGLVLRARAGHVEPVLPLAREAFAEALVCAATDDTLLGRRGVGIRLGRPGGPIAHAYILPIGHARARTFGGAGAAIFITASERHRPPPVAILMTMLDLDPHEARIMLALSAGKSIDETAEALGTAPARVNIQAKGLFVKLGVTGASGVRRVARAYELPEAFDPAAPLPGLPQR